MQVNEHEPAAGEIPARIEAALEYARQGWHVLPLHTATDSGCSCASQDCSSPGKHPLTPHGLKDATTDEGQIQRWWTQWPNANIGDRKSVV